MLWSNLKNKLSQHPLYGCFVTFPSPGLTEFTAQMGFDFTLIDNEHGNMDDAMMENMIRASQSAGVPSIVRTATNRAEYIQKSLDSGANGIQIPMVNTAEEAKEVVAAAHYPPLGKRGFDTLPRACHYTLYPDKREYIKRANDELLVIVQIETAEAVRNLEAILAVEGVDIFFIGPFDLALSLGYDDSNHPEVVKTVKRCLTLIRNHNKIAGIYAGDIESTKQVAQWGAHFIVTDLTTAMAQWSSHYLSRVKE